MHELKRTRLDCQRDMKIKKLLCTLSVCFCCTSLSFGQSLYERIPDQGKQLSVLLLGYRSNDFKVFGSASIFFVPITLAGQTHSGNCESVQREPEIFFRLIYFARVYVGGGRPDTGVFGFQPGIGLARRRVVDTFTP